MRGGGTTHKHIWFLLALLGCISVFIGGEAVTSAPAGTGEGVIYYVLTEDNEITTRYPQRIGGSILTRRAFEVLMIEKVDRLNEIAAKYSARWTHFTAVGPWFLALEGEQRSPAWRGLYDKLIEQVKRGSAAGHEFAPHPHAYWDPRVEQNTAVWSTAHDGFVDNGGAYDSWTAGFRRLGDYTELASAAGYLYDHKKRLMEITRRETVVERTGSWQFGHTRQLMSISLAALRLNGILGNSDADANLSEQGNAGRSYDQSLYFTAPDSINARASGDDYGTLEFTPTPIPIILYDSNNLADLNAKVDQGVRYFTDTNGKVKPGVHFIVGFTHAKNMMGAGSWESAQGDDFATLDQHLAYVARRYVNVKNPVIRFATASEAVMAYYDAHAPKPLAVREDDERQVAAGVYEYGVRILAGGNRLCEVSVRPPIWWDAAEQIKSVDILADGEVIATFRGFTSPYPELPFRAPGEARITMRVTLK